MAFSTSGLCLGTMIFSPVHRLLIQTFGWRGGLIFFSGIVLQCTVFAALMRPPDPYGNSRSAPLRKKLSEENVTGTVEVSRCASVIQSASAVLRHFQKALRVSHLKNAKLLLFLSIKAFSAAGNVTAYKFCIARAVHQGVDKFYASFLVTAIGLNSCTFRYVAGFIGNTQCADRLTLYTLSSLLGGLTVMFSVFCDSHFYTHLVFSLMYGAFLGKSRLYESDYG